MVYLLLIVGVAVGVFFGLLITAVILRAACHFLSVREPGLGRAMLISFIVGLVGTVINVVIISVFAGAGAAGKAGAAAGSTNWLFNAISVVVNMFVAGGIYSTMIPGVSFGRGILIYWVQVLIILVIAVILFAVFSAIGFVGR